MGRYASQTTVSSEKSRNEIERMVTNYGADRFAYAWESEQAVIAFRMADRNIRFNLPMPDRNSDEFRLTPAQRVKRSEVDAERAYEQVLKIHRDVGDRHSEPHEASLFDIDSKYGDVVSKAEVLEYMASPVDVSIS